MDQQERLALAVAAEVAGTRSDRASALASRLLRRASLMDSREFTVYRTAMREAERHAGLFLAARNALFDAMEAAGAENALNWIGCTQTDLDRAVAEALAADQPEH